MWASLLSLSFCTGLYIPRISTKRHGSKEGRKKKGRGRGSEEGGREGGGMKKRREENNVVQGTL